jgi:chemotaxis protein methyltransferase CheR
MTEMTPLAARALAGLLEQCTGQQLVTGRRWRIETALQPVMRTHGVANLDVLAGMVATPGSTQLRDDVVEALLNHETSFFRDLIVFRSVADEVLPLLADARIGRRRLRIWSAGCSTGQEAYSLALLFANQAAKWNDWAIEILGTDVSPQAIAQAREGLYSQFEVQRGLPITDLLTRFDQEGESWRIKHQAIVRPTFVVHNLLDAPPAGHFDLVLCRNVLLYFSAERRRHVLDRLSQAVAPDGLLMLGAGETVLGQTEAFTPDAAVRGAYRRTSPPA